VTLFLLWMVLLNWFFRTDGFVGRSFNLRSIWILATFLHHCISSLARLQEHRFNQRLHSFYHICNMILCDMGLLDAENPPNTKSVGWFISFSNNPLATQLCQSLVIFLALFQAVTTLRSMISTGQMDKFEGDMGRLDFTHVEFSNPVELIFLIHNTT
jgi:hypothetical protein